MVETLKFYFNFRINVWLVKKKWNMSFPVRISDLKIGSKLKLTKFEKYFYNNKS